MAVRLHIDEGPDLLIGASLDEANRAFQAALETNEPIQVQTSRGKVSINPQRILYLSEVPEEELAEAREAAEVGEPAGAH